MSGDLILVTGATGFIGSHVCRLLVAEGFAVRGLHRATPPRGLSDCDWYAVSDLADRKGLARALAGVDAVVHLAARVHVMKDRASDPLAEFRHVNVDGTAVLLEECRRAGVAKFIFGSSVKAVAEASESPLKEDNAPRPTDPYGISKLEAESVVLEHAQEGVMSATVLRFPLVYGPGMKGNMLALFGLVDRGVPLPLARVENRRTVLYVGNLAMAIRALLRAAPGGHQVYFVGDAEPLSTPELIREIASALDTGARLVPVPPSMLRACSDLAGILDRLGLPTSTTAAGFDRLLDSLVMDTSRIHDELDFEPPYTTTTGLRETANWYRSART